MRKWASETTRHQFSSNPGGRGIQRASEAIGDLEQHLRGEGVDASDIEELTPDERQTVARTASHQDVEYLRSFASAEGWEVEEKTDPMFGNITGLTLRWSGRYIIGVKLGVAPAMPESFKSATLSTMDPMGWAASHISETTNRGVVSDWLQLSFLDEGDDDDRYSSKRTAGSMFDVMEASETRHSSVGWDWDNRLSGYTTVGSSAHFSCVCGSNVEAPGYANCSCGRIWNASLIQEASGVRIVCREIPVRENVMLASKPRKTASAWTAQEALDQLGQTARQYGIPEKVLNCKECWNTAESVAMDEANDPDGYAFGRPVLPMALDYLSNGDLYCEEHSDW